LPTSLVPAYLLKSVTTEHDSRRPSIEGVRRVRAGHQGLRAQHPHLNDSGTPNGQDEQVSIATFMKAWKTSNCAMVVTTETGKLTRPGESGDFLI
jgi:hypothetical protein